MINKSHFNATDQRGVILISVLIIVIVFSIIGLSLSSASVGQFISASNDVYSDSSVLVAEAGIEQSLSQLNQNDNFAGYTTAQTFFDNSTQGKGVFTSVVANTTNSNAKTITSTGTVYRTDKTTKALSSRTVKVTVVGTSAPGYGVVSGPGGLILSGSANITNSDVDINGTLTLSGASKIGTSTHPVNVNVANDACPTGNSPGSTYATVCTTGQPISLAQSTNIYGNVCATGQTSKGPNNNIQGGTGGQGLEVGCTAPVISMPSYDRSSQISAVTTTASGTSNTYVCNSYPFNRTWPANLELTGNVNIGGSCNVVIKGNVYITGTLTIGGAATITVDNSLGTTRPVIMVDGKLTVGGSAQLVANSSGTGIQFIDYLSNASCSPNCTTLSGNTLKSAQSYETINVGGAVKLPGMIFEAMFGKLTLAGSGSVGSAAGLTVDMSGAGTVTFGTTLSSGTQTWTITSYQQVFP